MSSMICPTITATTIDEYNRQIDNVRGFASRIHIDLMDGDFAPSKSVEVADVWWPENIAADIHVMYRNPESIISDLVRLKPNMVIVHPESSCDVAKFAAELRTHGIRTGLALLPATTVDSVEYLLPHVQQVLIFSGNLGYQGGSEVDLELLGKAEEITRDWRHLEEIAWDGGINSDNAAVLVKGGIQVLNIGSFIQSSTNPAGAYRLIVQQISGI